MSIHGCNGRGIAAGTVYGRILAKLVLGEVRIEDLPVPVTESIPIAFRRLREAAFESGALLAQAS